PSVVRGDRGSVSLSTWHGSIISGQLHMGPHQDGSLIQEVAEPQAFEQFLGASRAVRTDLETGPEHSLVGQFGIQQEGSQVNRLLPVAIGTAPYERPAHAGQARATGRGAGAPGGRTSASSQ